MERDLYYVPYGATESERIVKYGYDGIENFKVDDKGTASFDYNHKYVQLGAGRWSFYRKDALYIILSRINEMKFDLNSKESRVIKEITGA